MFFNIGAYVGRCWHILDHLGVMLGSSWLQLGPLGPTLALSWAILGSLGAHLGAAGHHEPCKNCGENDVWRHNAKHRQR